VRETDLPAYCFNKTFPPCPPKTMQFDRHYLLYSATGAMRLEAEDRYWILPPSRAVWIPPNTPLQIEISKPSECCSILFDPKFIQSPYSQCQVITLPSIIREMILFSRKWGPETIEFDEYATHFFQSLAHMCAELKSLPSEVWYPKGKTQKVSQALHYTLKNISNPITFGDVADTIGMTERSLARYFSKEIDMTWSQLIRRMRMIKAIELLCNNDDQILNISIDVGYSSLSSFNKAFKEFTGKSPKEFRTEY